MKKRRNVPVEAIENKAPWDRVLSAGIPTVLERRRRLIELGIIDEDGRRLNQELPADMQDQSETSV